MSYDCNGNISNQACDIDLSARYILLHSCVSTFSYILLENYIISIYVYEC